MNHRQYFDRVAATWDARLPEEALVRLRQSVSSLDIIPGARVLDVGCGTGVLLPLLYEKVRCTGRIIALDMSREMIRRARSKGPLALCVQADAQHLPFADGLFDWVICNAVFPHFPDKRRALAELRRVLRDAEPARGRIGGHLVILHTANRRRINEIHRSIGGVLSHDAIPKEGEMRLLLSETGLGQVQMQDEPDRYLVLARRIDR
jgi:ubiquinone/menaquinone biosynthesis C-methylase UbiE